MDNVFVIGDVHGNLDRLEALLRQEGLLGRCEVCDGGGEIDLYQDEHKVPYDRVDCINCQGLGMLRLRKDVTVIQLGDLGHFGQDGSPTADTLCYKYVTDNRWCDLVLWGNHDRAQVDATISFSGFLKNHAAMHYIRKLMDEGRLKVAHEAHGFLLTHAGLALAFRDQKVDSDLKTDPTKFADWLNEEDARYLDAWINGKGGEGIDINAAAIVLAIGAKRGGRVNTGGVLWRDISEKLYGGFRQVFGHSADHEKRAIRYCDERSYTRLTPDHPYSGSYCIDIGGKSGKGANCLAGIYLPSENTAKVDL